MAPGEINGVLGTALHKRRPGVETRRRMNILNREAV